MSNNNASQWIWRTGGKPVFYTAQECVRKNGKNKIAKFLKKFPNADLRNYLHQRFGSRLFGTNKK